MYAHTPLPTSQFLNKYNTHNHKKQIGQFPRTIFSAGWGAEGQEVAAEGSALAHTVAASSPPGGPGRPCLIRLLPPRQSCQEEAENVCFRSPP